MNLYVAPLEGITGYIFRNAFNDYFGTGVDKYYTPFLTLCNKKGIVDKEKREVSPENNQGYKLVPQIMTVSVEDFLKAKEKLREIGYEELNLNFGCPSKTVFARGRGSGALGDLTKLEGFLDGVYKDGDKNISIKTRIGVENPEEFEQIMEIYNQYPIKELTIHPRTRAEQYKGTAHRDVFLAALSKAKMPVCYNGDINTVEDFQQLCKDIENGSSNTISGVMIGRGILRDPALIRKIKAFSEDKAAYLAGDSEKYEATSEEMLGWLGRLQVDYEEIMYGEVPILYKLKAIWGYLGQGIYEDNKKLFKKIIKSKSLMEYEGYMKQVILQGNRVN